LTSIEEDARLIMEKDKSLQEKKEKEKENECGQIYTVVLCWDMPCLDRCDAYRSGIFTVCLLDIY
jgi:hypothetical protein